MRHLLKLVVRGFLRVLRFPLLLHRFMVSAHEIRLTQMRGHLCQTLRLSWVIAPCDKRHVVRDKAPYVLHVICSPLRLGHLSLRAGACLLVGCLTSQQQASVSQGRICSDNCTCCHTEIEIADQTFYLTQSQYTDTGPTSPSADPITPGAWQGSQWSANFKSLV